MRPLTRFPTPSVMLGLLLMPILVGLNPSLSNPLVIPAQASAAVGVSASQIT